MNSQPTNHHQHLPPPPEDPEVHHLPPVQVKPSPSSASSPASASFSVSYNTPTSTSSPPIPTPTFSAQRRIGIPVDLSNESAFAVKWAVQNYLRPGDAVILLHVRPTSVLYGADWGSNTPTSTSTPPPSPITTTAPTTPTPPDQKVEEDYDNMTTTKATKLAQPLVEAHVPFKIHIVKDHDLKERLCLEVERLGLSTVIMGSRGSGASMRNEKGRLGSVSDYCVQHCVCPVVVVRYTEDKKPEQNSGGGEVVKKAAIAAQNADLHPSPEEEQEFHDADDHDLKGAA